jgi:molybdopterin molybdotransferase
MDGFAIRSADGATPRRIAGESRAGAPARVPLGEGEAIRISTGAAVPEGADAVVQVERTSEEDGIIRVDGDVAPGANVRNRGEDLPAGDVVLERGLRLGPAELGVAVGAGRGTVRCTAVPRVAILGTGDELVAPGEPLGPGQIHESNTIALAALATTDGARVVSNELAPDDAAATERALAAALQDADVVLVSGGVSVGPHDHVKPSLERLGVAERFWRVALRPGKPTWFGTRGRTLVLGLPGNPVSAVVTYVLFGRLALATLQGAPPPRRRRAPLAHALPRHEARDEAVRVHLDDDGRAHSTGAQDSHLLSSMRGADALALVPRGEGVLPPGTVVELEPL